MADINEDELTGFMPPVYARALTPVPVIATGTVVANTRENVKLPGASITRTLPPLPTAGQSPISGLILDAGRTASPSQKIQVFPPTGKNFETLPVNEPLNINYAGGWLSYSAAQGDTAYSFETQASTLNSVIANAPSLVPGYEENDTWIPVVTLSNNVTGTPVISNSSYTKIGRQIFFSFDVSGVLQTTTNTFTSLDITNIPYLMPDIGGDSAASVGGQIFIAGPSGPRWIYGGVIDASAGDNNRFAATWVANTAVGAVSLIKISGYYRI